MPAGIYTKTEEHKLKLSEAGKNRRHSNETKIKMSKSHRGINIWSKGKSLSGQHKKHISESLIGSNHPMYGKHHTIEARLKMSDAKKGKISPRKGVKCSEETIKKMRLAVSGEKHPNWKGGKVLRKCYVCGKGTEVPPHIIRKGWGKFCSLRCSSIWNVQHQRKKDTDIEILMGVELKKQMMPYLQQVPIEGIALVDFLLPNKIIIQCDGMYWHSKKEVKNRDIKQDFLLRFKGYKVFRFTDKEIKTPSLAIKLLEIWKGQGGQNASG